MLPTQQPDPNNIHCLGATLLFQSHTFKIYLLKLCQIYTIILCVICMIQTCRVLIWKADIQKRPLFKNDCSLDVHYSYPAKHSYQLFICRFYPYVLITSTVFLLITLAIYTIWSQLLNLYTRLMRHFTLAMLLAFVSLSINQLITLGNYSAILCSIMGLFLFI